MSKMEKRIKGILLSRLRRYEEELNQWMHENHTITHQHHAIDRSGYDLLNEDYLAIYCDNATRFCKEEPKDKIEVFHFGSFKVLITTIHCGNLTCSGFCEFYSDVHALHDFYERAKPLIIIPEKDFI